MPDPVTIGALAASALSMAGDEALKGVLGEAAKDAYDKLKQIVSHSAGADVAALEKTPSSPNRQGIVAEAIDARPPNQQAEVKALATALAAALKSGAGPVGLDVGKLTALEVQLDTISVAGGTGARFGEVNAETFRAGPINVGPPAGKTEK